jgi:hypothetical protein
MQRGNNLDLLIRYGRNRNEAHSGFDIVQEPAFRNPGNVVHLFHLCRVLRQRVELTNFPVGFCVHQLAFGGVHGSHRGQCCEAVAAVLTNDLRLILFISSFRDSVSMYSLRPDLVEEIDRSVSPSLAC